MDKTETKGQPKDYGCDDCVYCRSHRCGLWEVKVEDPHNSHCVSLTTKEEADARGIRVKGG